VRGRLVGFAVVCAVLAAVGVWLLGRDRGGGAHGVANARTNAEAWAHILSGPHLVFRSTDLEHGYGRIALAPLDRPNERVVSDLACERIDVAAARGICLAADRGFLTTYSARLLDGDLAPGASIPLTGLPSRARMSPDGRYAAYTVFESGHSYTTAGFSTRTSIVDARTGDLVGGDPEQWRVTRDGSELRAPDFNLWGVTFAPDGKRVYATLATGGQTLLVEGSLATHEFRVLRAGVECPSLSPDGRRIVYKSRRSEGGRLVFGLRVLELESGADAALDGETRSVDDQAQWLDDAHVLYGLPETREPATGGSDVWVMEARPGTAPRILLERAFSPSVVR
jgi:hypothetical protein